MEELKVLLVTAERMEGADAADAARQLGRLVSELHIIDMSIAAGIEQKQDLGKNVSIYGSKDATETGKQVVFDRKFVRGKSVIAAADPKKCASVASSVSRRWKLPLEVAYDLNAHRLGFWQKRMIGRTLASATAVCVPSEDVKGDIASVFGLEKKLISVVPPSLDKESVAAEKPSFDLAARYGWDFIMLAASSDHEEDKDLAMAVDVLGRIRAHYPQAGLVIIGPCKEQGELMTRARRLGAGGGLAFLEGTPEETASAYGTAQLFIQTSGFENYGVELVRAGLHGLPVVTTPVGLAKELKDGSEALICPLGDAEYMFKAIYDLIGNNALRETLRSGVRRAFTEKVPSSADVARQRVEAWTRIASMVTAS